jgi:hypothetical protein
MRREASRMMTFCYPFFIQVIGVKNGALLFPEEPVWPEARELFIAGDHFGNVKGMVLHAPVKVKHIGVGQAEVGRNLFFL